MSFAANRYVPIFCDKSLQWFERTYDFFHLHKWEDFEKNSNMYFENVPIVSFSDIYRSIGFKPVNNSLKQFRKFTPEELLEFKTKKY